MSNQAMIMQQLQKELTDYSQEQIQAVLNLLEEGNTVPFIARYRKEATGSLDEVQIREIESQHTYLSNLAERKDEVLKSIADQDKLTPELEAAIMQAEKLQEVEDLYLPYKKKRRTKAQIARERGLQPLADWIRTFPEEADIQAKAVDFIDPAQEIETADDALAGAHEIIAEEIGDNAKYRMRVRQITNHLAYLTSTVKDEEKDPKKVYEMYYDFSESVKKLSSHQVLATNRGEKEEILTVKIELDEDQVLAYLTKQELKDAGDSPTAPLVEEATADAYKRFIKPAIERELRNQLTEAAEDQAISVFSGNLRNLLLQPPLKEQTILGVDPAFRTGCKLAVIDPTGKVLAVDVIYPHHPAPAKQRQAAEQTFIKILEDYDVDTIAIGNGTASRETEAFVAENIQKVDKPIAYVIVSESGASVYSASDEAREEFPDLQVEERSAINIARRLQDPLAELVKIDPRSIGVGQYQHDVNQNRLSDELDVVVETVVNQVGVNVNTASASLLIHIAGLNKTTAKNIVKYRDENGPFAKRSQLKEVPRVGPKAYEQSVGFLRIPNGDNPLDNTGIHPETYSETKQILDMAQVDLDKIGSPEATSSIKQLDKKAVAEETDLGPATSQDILQALVQPGRDMRDGMPAPLLKTDVISLKDLKPGMQMQGTVRNVVDFGAFVDIGVGQDGLVHISKMSEKFIDHPKDLVSVGDIVTVWVDEVDTAKERIALTMIQA